MKIDKIKLTRFIDNKYEKNKFNKTPKATEEDLLKYYEYYQIELKIKYGCSGNYVSTNLSLVELVNLIESL